MKTNKKCPTCGNDFVAARKDKTFCSRICARRNPETAKRYSDRTSAYQAKIARKPWRRYAKLKHKCSHEAKELNISKEQYETLIQNPCTYCESDISLETGVGLDRLNNDIGYTLVNVVPCCGKCNQIRNTHLTHDEMKVAMKAIIELRKTLGERRSVNATQNV